MILGQDPNSTRPIGTEKTLKEAKEYILSRAYNNDYCAIYVSFEKKSKLIDYKKVIF